MEYIGNDHLVHRLFKQHQLSWSRSRIYAYKESRKKCTRIKIKFQKTTIIQVNADWDFLNISLQTAVYTVQKQIDILSNMDLMEWSSEQIWWAFWWLLYSEQSWQKRGFLLTLVTNLKYRKLVKPYCYCSKM